MSTIILYYSFSGTSKRQAELLAEKYDGATVTEIKEQKQRNMLTVIIPGCIQALRRKASAILPLDQKLTEFDRIVIVMPIWAGRPVPAFYSVVKLIPAGREVELYFCSGSGTTAGSEGGTRQILAEKGCILMAYHNIKASTIPS